MKNPWKKLLANVKTSGSNRKKEVKVEWQDLRNKFLEQGLCCYYYQIPLLPSWIFDPYNPLALSVDRIDNKGHYTWNNIVICCRWANLGRNATPSERFIESVSYLREYWAINLISDLLYKPGFQRNITVWHQIRSRLNYQEKCMSAKTAKGRRAAALKAWETRRQTTSEESEKRSNTARKANKTKRKNVQTAAEKRSAAAHKAWATRRAKS
jgi:hypothetical protein